MEELQSQISNNTTLQLYYQNLLRWVIGLRGRRYILPAISSLIQYWNIYHSWATVHWVLGPASYSFRKYEVIIYARLSFNENAIYTNHVTELQGARLGWLYSSQHASSISFKCCKSKIVTIVTCPPVKHFVHFLIQLGMLIPLIIHIR